MPRLPENSAISGLAYLSAVDQVDEDGDGKNEDVIFNITRLRRDFGSNSVAGVTFTDRSLLDSPAYNRVLAGDVRYVFAKLYYFQAQAGGSWTTTGSGPVASSPIWKLELDRTGRAWGFNYQLNGVGKDFTTRSGFVNRNDISNASVFNRFTSTASEGRCWRITPCSSGPVESGVTTTSAVTPSREATRCIILFSLGGWNADIQVNREFVDFTPRLHRGLGRYPCGGISPSTSLREFRSHLNIGLETPTYQLFQRRCRAWLRADGNLRRSRRREWS